MPINLHAKIHTGKNTWLRSAPGGISYYPINKDVASLLCLYASTVCLVCWQVQTSSDHTGNEQYDVGIKKKFYFLRDDCCLSNINSKVIR